METATHVAARTLGVALGRVGNRRDVVLLRHRIEPDMRRDRTPNEAPHHVLRRQLLVRVHRIEQLGGAHPDDIRRRDLGRRPWVGRGPLTASLPGEPGRLGSLEALGDLLPLHVGPPVELGHACTSTHGKIDPMQHVRYDETGDHDEQRRILRH